MAFSQTCISVALWGKQDKGTQQQQSRGDLMFWVSTCMFSRTGQTSQPACWRAVPQHGWGILPRWICSRFSVWRPDDYMILFSFLLWELWIKDAESMTYEGLDLQNSLLQSPPSLTSLLTCRRISLFPEKKIILEPLWYCSKAARGHPEVGGWVLAILELQLGESQLKLVKSVATP